MSGVFAEFWNATYGFSKGKKTVQDSALAKK